MSGRKNKSGKPAATRRQKIPVADYLRRSRRRRVRLSLLAIVVMSLWMWVDHRGWLLYEGDLLARYDGQWFEVIHVVDGDTLDIDVPDGDQPFTRIRLWGIDTPETAKPWLNEPAEPWADEATAFTREHTLNRQVRLILEPHAVRDRFGRLLAYIELDDGLILNELLLLEGLARWVDRFSHRHLERYELLQLQARRQRQGLWAEPPDPPEPPEVPQAATAHEAPASPAPMYAPESSEPSESMR